MVIVICPTESQRILPRLLNSPRSIATQPVLALGGEEQFACAVSTQVRDRCIDKLCRVGEPVGIMIELAFSQPERLCVAGDLTQPNVFARSRLEGQRPVTFDHPHLDTVLPRDSRATQ